MMRVLTVRQPWAWAIVHGGKDVENRVRNIAGDYRGPVAIHAALAYDGVAFGDPRVVRATRVHDDDHDLMVNDLMVVGHILGVVDLVGVHQEDGPECLGRAPGWHCSEWGEEYRWHLQFANARPLVEPLPFRGALGLRSLPADVERLVLEGVR